MQKWAVVFLFFILMTGACTLQNLDDTQGVVWEYYLYSSEVVAGIQLMEDMVFFADDNATVYALNSGTGTYNWSRTLSNNTILSLYAEGSHLFVITSSNSQAYLYKYDAVLAILDGPVIELPFIPHPHYLTEYDQFTSTQHIILNNSNRVVIYDLVTMTSNTGADVSGSLDDMVSVIAEDDDSNGSLDYYYLIGRSGNILKRYNTLIDTGISLTSPLPGKFSGSALFANSSLFIGTDKGVYKVPNTLGVFEQDDTVSVKVGQMYWHNNKLYAPSNEFSKTGVIRYSSYLGLQFEWFYTSYSDITYSPVVVDEVNNVVAFVDDAGSIHVMNDGDYVAQRLYELYLSGQLLQGDVGIPIDYSSVIYIPFMNKVLSYSLEWAANQQGVF